MIMRKMVLIPTLLGLLALPTAVSARTFHCRNISASGIYNVVGHQVSCSTAKAVAKAEVRALLTPGSGAKHYIKVKGKRWHYTWRNVNTSPTTQIEYYTARSGKQKVTFATHGAN